MRRTREAALETRTRILDCAELVFAESGVARATLEDIARAAGVTRGAIYGHFANKAEIYDAVVARVKLPMDMLFDAANDPRAADPLGSLHHALAACLRAMARDPRTARVFTILLAQAAGDPAGEWHRQAMASSAAARTRFVEALRNAVGKGQLPADLAPEPAAALLKAALTGVLRDWLLDPHGLALPRDADAIAGALLDMLRFSPSLRRRARVRRR